ncbi:MAG: hypothetical protein Q7K42_05130 [Candidatus Diapherotrites archaeon]|nr:hypothetical protein [Candidatus Diapherotrites archaeon]
MVVCEKCGKEIIKYEELAVAVRTFLRIKYARLEEIIEFFNPFKYKVLHTDCIGTVEGIIGNYFYFRTKKGLAKIIEILTSLGVLAIFALMVYAFSFIFSIQSNDIRTTAITIFLGLIVIFMAIEIILKVFTGITKFKELKQEIEEKHPQ